MNNVTETSVKSHLHNSEKLKARLHAYNPADKCGYISGTPIDRYLRLDKTTLTVLCADPCQGKTTLLNWYTTQLAHNADLRVLYFSFETGLDDQMYDLLQLYKDENELFERCYFLQEGERDLNDIVETIYQNKEHNDINVVIIDTFKDVVVSGAMEADQTIITTLKNVAVTLDIAVILVCHQTKSKSYTDGRVSIKNAPGTYQIEATADNCIAMESNLNDKTTTLHFEKVRKARHGQVGSYITLQFHPETNTYTEYDPTQPIYGDTPNTHATNDVNDFYTDSLRIAREVNRDEDKKRVNIDEIKNTVIDRYNGFFDPTPIRTTIGEVLQLGEQYKTDIDKLRTLPHEQQRQIKSQLPSFTPCCTCPEKRDKNTAEWNGTICIDIDSKDNPHLTIDRIMMLIKELKHVYYYAVSVGGKGVFALVKCDKTKGDFSQYFDALVTYFARVGIKIDKACKDVARMRVVSYGGHEWNEDARIYELLPSPPTTPKNTPNTRQDSARVGYQKSVSPNYQNLTAPTNHTTSVNTVISDREKADFDTLMTQAIADGKAFISDHTDTLTLAMCMASVYGQNDRERAVKLLCEARKLRENYGGDYKYEQMYNNTVADPTKRNAHPVATLKNLLGKITQN